MSYMSMTIYDIIHMTIYDTLESKGCGVGDSNPTVEKNFFVMFTCSENFSPKLFHSKIFIYCTRKMILNMQIDIPSGNVYAPRNISSPLALPIFRGYHNITMCNYWCIT